MADNPYAKFVSTTTPDDNPYAKFTPKTSEVASDSPYAKHVKEAPAKEAEGGGWFPTAREFKEEGFLGRVLTGTGVLEKEKEQPKPKEPDMTLKESLSATWKGVTEHPLDMAKAFTRGVIEDPELLYPGLWEGELLRLGQAAKAAEAVGAAANAEKKLEGAAKLVAHAKAVGGTAARAGAVGAAFETAAEAAQDKAVNVQRVVNTAGNFAAFGGTARAAGEIVGALKTPEGETKTTRTGTVEEQIKRDREEKKLRAAEARKREAEAFKPPKLELEPYQSWKKAQGENKVTVQDYKKYVDDVTRAHEDNVMKLEEKHNERLALKKATEEANLKQERVEHSIDEAAPMLAPKDVGFGHVQDFLHTMNKIAWNTKVEANDIKAAVPHEEIRKDMTMALEKQDKWAGLKTDEERRKMLYGSYESKDSVLKSLKRASEARKFGQVAEAETGMVGALEKLRIMRDTGNYKKYETFENISKTIKGLENVIDMWENKPSQESAIPVLKHIQDNWFEIGKKARDLGLMKGLLRNYVPHMLNFKEFKGSEFEKNAILDKVMGIMKPSLFERDFTLPRFYQTMKDLEEALGRTGIIVEKDIAKLYEQYNNSMLKAIAEKNLVNNLKETPVFKDSKEKILREPSKEAVKDGYVAFTGENAGALEGLLVHPNFVDQMGFVFRQKDPNQFIRAVKNVTMLGKTIQTTASLFHFKSLAESTLVSSPLAFVKEVFTGGSGIRAAKKAFETGDKDGSHRMNMWHDAGLMLGTEDIERSIVGEAGIWADKMLSKFGPEVKLVQRATTPFDKYVIQNVNKLTWDYMHTGGKIFVANLKFDQMKRAHPEMPDAQVAKEVASWTNNTFGGLDWSEIAASAQHDLTKAIAMKAYGQSGRELAQIMVFAPDWTASTIRSFSEALPKELSKPSMAKFREGVSGVWNPKTRQDLARRYVINVAITYLTIMNGVNYALSGHPISQNKEGKKTKIDRGDGTYIQLAKHSMEVPELITEPSSVGNKLGFVPKSFSELAIGRRNPFTAKSTIKDDSAVNRVLAVLESFEPMPVSSAMQAPTGEGAKRAAFSMLGAPVLGQTNAAHTSHAVQRERLKKRLERKKENLMKKREALNK